jgi:peptidoglycan hydrolase CwlO-like protein
MKLFSFSKSILWSALCFLMAMCLMVGTLRAEECEDMKCDDDDEECWEDKRECLEDKITETQQQAATLQGAVDGYNRQIAAQQALVNTTLAQITQLEKEITELSERIEGLTSSLDRLGTVLIERVRSQYKQSRSSPELRLLGAESFSSLITQMKYLLLAQRQTADTMERTENQRLEYDEQKTLKEEKQAELDEKRRQLEAERTALAQKRAQQQDLLNITNNSEQRYQQLLAEANDQLASFTRFARSIGVSLLSGQTHCNDWGCYYSQRDSQWGNQRLGNSSYTLAEAGCLVTSVAMVTSHYDKTLTPAQIARSTSVFQGAGLEFNMTVNGVTVNRSPACSSSSCLDDVLDDDRPAIVRIRAANFAGTHFVVITEKKDGNYIMHDPAIANGHDKKFTDYYSLSDITRVDRVSVR